MLNDGWTPLDLRHIGALVFSAWISGFQTDESIVNATAIAYHLAKSVLQHSDDATYASGHFILTIGADHD